MPKNVEIKARVRDAAALRARAEALADGPAVELVQHDVFYAAPCGRLKLRRFADGAGELIWYQRPDTPDPEASRYTVVPAPDPDALHAALAAGLGVRGEVRKRRLLLMRGRTRIHLDAVAGLGDFLELEVVLAADEDEAAGRAEAEALMADLGVDPADLLATAYVDLLEAADPAPE